MSLSLSRRALSATLAGLLVAPQVTAASDPLEAEAPFFEELPTVLSASRLPQALNEAPGAVTVLDRDFIRATGYRDLARVLRLVPGMQVGQERGHRHWVTYHGLSSDYPAELQVLIDGRSVYTPNTFGGADWSALPITLDEIERVEVVRGTNSNAYGANAFLGVINIITRHTSQDRGSSAAFNLGNRGIVDTRLTWTGGNESMGTRLSFASSRDQGFEHIYDKSDSQTVNLRTDYRLNGQDELTLRAGFNRSRRGQGYDDTLFDNNGLRTSSTDNSTVHLTWRRTLSEDEEWLLNFYNNHDNTREAWVASGLPALDILVPLNRNRSSDRTNLELQHRFALNDAARMVWGLETRRDMVHSPFLFMDGDPPTQYLYRAFSNLDWHLSKDWQLNLGGLLEKDGARVPQFSPRAFINWQVAQGHTLRAGYARAWQQSNTFNLYSSLRVYEPTTGALVAWPYLPNLELRTPHVDTIEAGYLGRFRPLDTTVDVRLFRERIEDFMVRRTLVSPAGNLPLPLYTTQFVNLDTPVILNGVEYQIQTHPWAGGEIRFNHSLTQRNTTSTAVSQRTSPYTLSASWLQEYDGGWTTTVSVLRIGSLAGGDGYGPGFEDTSKPYTTADVRTTKRLHIGQNPAEISLNAINLGSRHQEIADRSEQVMHPEGPVNYAPRMVWLGLTMGL
ncbi:MAG: TonB-dependent receptor [Rhodocyclales bacterium]|nr:TonB-dependent receptor [Rhodocyclales bacterium]